ncbi:GNAT family N-acetyltransferase [Kitasatospora sp. NPDC004289]
MHRIGGLGMTGSWALRRVPGRGCGDGRHWIRTGHFDLYTPRTVLDVIVLDAMSADEEAREQLGLVRDEAYTEELVADLLRLGNGRFTAEQRRRLNPGLRRPTPLTAGLVGLLTVVHRKDRRYAGMASLNLEAREIGGWLAPDYRYRGFGAEVAAAVTDLAHRHFGLATVRAGTAVTNRAGLRTLEAAGFVPAEGPARHVLPNGREVAAAWYRHGADHVRRCRALG